eukprot:5695154-Prymnesium_polylepis.1
MTTGLGPTQKELSPALYNRFNTVHMDPLHPSEATNELERVVAAVLGDAATLDGQNVTNTVAGLCKDLWFASGTDGAVLAQPLTFRSLVRMLDSVYRLWCIRSMDLPEALSDAYGATVKGLFKAGHAAARAQEQFNSQIEQAFGRRLNREQGNQSPASLALEELMRGVEQGMIVTESRRSYAEQVLLAVECNLPVLLEGPAAVGKTVLISSLARLYPRA